MDYSEFDALPSKTDEISISEEPSHDGIRFDPMEGEEDAIQLFRLLLETAKSADIPVGWGT